MMIETKTCKLLLLLLTFLQYIAAQDEAHVNAGIKDVEVSYVMEPFEELHDDATWFQYPQDDSTTRLSLELSADEALFGKNAFKFDYFTSTFKSVGFGWIQEERPHNCFDATHLSVWYKFLKSSHSSARLKLTLFDDTACVLLNETTCTSEQHLQAFSFFQGVHDHNDPPADDDDWHELRVPLSTQDTANLNLRRLRGWKIESVLSVKGGDDNSTTVPLTFSGSVLVDQLACVGGGDLLGAAFHLENTKNLSADGTWTDNYYQSYISQNTTRASLDNNGVLNINPYAVEMVETWGGFVSFDHVAPGPAYYNISQATDVVIYYQVLKPASIPERCIFRLVLNDAGPCEKKECSDGYENYYSFHLILNENTTNYPDGLGQLVMPLSSSIDPGEPFWLTGWNGVIGNEQLDSQFIKGMTLELVLDGQLEQGSIVTGGIAFSNFSAVWKPTETNNWEEEGQCVFESGLISVTETVLHYNWIQYFGREKCCELCDEDPECLYFFTDYWDCYLASYLNPTDLQVPNTEDEIKWHTAYWMDDPLKRGDFCDRCECRQDDFTIDCRGRDLLIVPKTFGKAGWVPRTLDLRDNPRLPVLGTHALSAIAENLEEIRLPANMKHITPWSPKELPKLVSLLFADDEPGKDVMVPRADGLNFVAGSSSFFGDVCCSIGDHIDVPLGGLSFCNMTVAALGSDSVYLPFSYYPFAKQFKVFDPYSPFLAEAAESVEKCAEICSIFEECMVFEFDDRLPNAYPVCSLLENEGAEGLKTVCCDDVHYADENKTLPGYTSGRPPHTRHEFDDARVMFSTSELTASKENSYKTRFEVFLRSTPLRGAVWVIPTLVSKTALNVSISPSRVALYDAESTASVEVRVFNVNAASSSHTLVIENQIESCDAAFSLTDSDKSANTIFVEVVPPEDDNVNLAVALTVPIVLVALSFVLLFFLHSDDKKRKNDAVWKVKNDELKFGNPPAILGRGTFGLVLLAEYRGTNVAVKRVIPPRGYQARKDKSEELSSEPSFDLPNDEPKLAGGSKVSSKFGTSSWAGSALDNLSLPTEALASSDTSYVKMSDSGTRLKSMSRNEAAIWRKLKKDFVKEMRYISKLRHPCVTTVMGAVIDNNVEPMLVMECMDHGSLYDLLHNETVMLEGEILLPMMRDIAQGMRFLHSADPSVIHGDLKAANILVDSKFRAKVADFGLSQKRHMGATGTPFWMAPELLRGDSHNTAASDVYAFGIILYEVYSRCEPYEGEDFREVLRLVADKTINKRPPVPPASPAQVQSLMFDCECEDPSQRPSFEEIDKRLKRVDAESVEPDQNDKKFRRTKRSSISLEDIFPKHIAKALKEGRAIEAEHREMVTVFFCDIVGYTNLSSILHATKVVDMLDRLYLKFDELTQRHDIFKLEVIGDCYIAASNLVKDQSHDHAKRVADFAIDAVAAAEGTLVDVEDPEKGFVQIRVGFHSGPVVADVVGNRNPKYCILGDTVNTASRMESNSDVNRIHCSDRSAELLNQQYPSLPLKPRGMIPIKGKGEMFTFWVNEGGTDHPHFQNKTEVRSDVPETHPSTNHEQCTSTYSSSGGIAVCDQKNSTEVQDEIEEVMV